MMRWSRVRRPWQWWDEDALRRGIGVYVHVPFCLSRCRYCGFLSYGAGSSAPFTPEAYCKVLLREIQHSGVWVREHYACERPVDSVFFGGGTPTCLSASRLVGLLSAVREHFPVAPGAECTVEANPETITREYVEALARAGVTRLSIGVQATQARHLRFLGRLYRWGAVEPLLRQLANGPVERLSFDLMCGIPQLRLAELKQSLQMILELRPSHLSLYELTCEPGTRYARWVAAYPRQRPTLEAVVAQQRMAARMLADYGFYRYEVSSYARPGAECLHNLRYWRGGDYVGLGLGAATRIEHVVVSNPREFNEYEQVVDRAGGSDDLRRGRSMLKRPAGNGVPAIAPAADRFLRLRTRAGVTADEISIKSEWLVRDWVRHSDRRLEVSAKGLSFADLMARQAD